MKEMRPLPASDFRFASSKLASATIVRFDPRHGTCVTPAQPGTGANPFGNNKVHSPSPMAETSAGLQRAGFTIRYVEEMEVREAKGETHIRIS